MYANVLLFGITAAVEVLNNLTAKPSQPPILPASGQQLMIGNYSFPENFELISSPLHVFGAADEQH